MMGAENFEQRRHSGEAQWFALSHSHGGVGAAKVSKDGGMQTKPGPIANAFF